LDDVPRALVIKHIHEVSGMKGLGGNWRRSLCGLPWQLSKGSIVAKLLSLNSAFCYPSNIKNQSKNFKHFPLFLVHPILHDQASSQTAERFAARWVFIKYS
jgi:hypothetical protein